MPLEVRNTALKSKEIRALGLLLTTLRTFITKTTQRNLFMVVSSYYKLYSLFRACAVAYGLGFLFSKADQVAGSFCSTSVSSTTNSVAAKNLLFLGC